MTTIIPKEVYNAILVLKRYCRCKVCFTEDEEKCPFFNEHSEGGCLLNKRPVNYPIVMTETQIIYTIEQG